MFKTELKRVGKQKWIWIMSFISLIICVGISFYIKVDFPENFNGKIYSYYMEELEGEFNYEKYTYIKSEYEKMQSLLDNENNYKQQYFEGELDENQYKEIKQKVDSAKYRIFTVEYILEKSYYFEELYQKGYKVQYFDDLAIADYVSSYRILIFLILASILIGLFMVYEDRQCNVKMLVDSSYFGRKKIRQARGFVYVLLIFVLTTIAIVLEFFIKLRSGSMSILEYSVVSIYGIKKCISYTIMDYLVIRAVIILLITLLSGCIVQFIGNKINSQK